MSNEDLRAHDEAWSVDSAASKRAIDRLARRSRNRKPPEGFCNGEDYRAWLLGVIGTLESNDVTEQECAETAAWRARVEVAAAGATRRAMTRSAWLYLFGVFGGICATWVGLGKVVELLADPASIGRYRN